MRFFCAHFRFTHLCSGENRLRSSEVRTGVFRAYFLAYLRFGANQCGANHRFQCQPDWQNSGNDNTEITRRSSGMAAVFDLPDAHRVRMRTTNGLERLNK